MCSHPCCVDFHRSRDKLPRNPNANIKNGAAFDSCYFLVAVAGWDGTGRGNPAPQAGALRSAGSAVTRRARSQGRRAPAGDGTPSRSRGAAAGVTDVTASRECGARHAPPPERKEGRHGATSRVAGAAGRPQPALTEPEVPFPVRECVTGVRPRRVRSLQSHTSTQRGGTDTTQATGVEM